MKTTDIEKNHAAGLITAEQRDQIIEHFGLKGEGGKFLVILSLIGTPLYTRLQNAGRILKGRARELCPLFDINFQPKNMIVAELQSGFLGLANQLYSAEETQARRVNFKRMLRTLPNFGRLARREEHWLVA